MTAILIIPDLSLGGEPPCAPGGSVALIHGLGRSPASMGLLGRRLARPGFAVWRVGYPSRRLTVAEAATRIAAALAPVAACVGRLHLVGHSLGGIIAARIAAGGELPVGRVVQIGSPNRGSVTGHRLLTLLPLGWCLGPAGTQLSAPLACPARRPGVAAIAGVGRAHLPGRLFGIWTTGDGTVALRSASAGAEAHGAVRCAHSLLPLSRRVAEMTAAFLRTGRFGLAGGGARQ